MTAAEIAEVLGTALSTISRWLARIGLGKRSRLQPPEPPNRYGRKEKAPETGQFGDQPQNFHFELGQAPAP